MTPHVHDRCALSRDLAVAERLLVVVVGVLVLVPEAPDGVA
jgi:hypothetical protein